MSRKTVVIGAMKPMTAGHYALITKAVADSEVPAGENPANETYVLMSIQDRTRKGEMPIYGETALEALKDFYLPTKDFMRFDQNTKKVNLVFCHSTKFANENPERINYIKTIVEGIKDVLQLNGIENVVVKLEEVKSGPPNFLIDLAESNPADEFILYTGTDDLKKYAYMPKYSPNILFAGFERFEGGLSGTETRKLISQENLSDEEKDRFSSVFPPGVDSDAIRNLYRKKAGLNESIKFILNETKLLDSIMGTEDYNNKMDDLITKLQDVKISLGSRKKKNQRYRKEAGILQNAISTLKHFKKKNQRLIDSNKINENFSRDDIKDFFKSIS